MVTDRAKRVSHEKAQEAQKWIPMVCPLCFLCLFVASGLSNFLIRVYPRPSAANGKPSATKKHKKHKNGSQWFAPSAFCASLWLAVSLIFLSVSIRVHLRLTSYGPKRCRYSLESTKPVTIPRGSLV